jgi:hypothetical protein
MQGNKQRFSITKGLDRLIGNWQDPERLLIAHEFKVSDNFDAPLVVTVVQDNRGTGSDLLQNLNELLQSAGSVHGLILIR